MFGLIVSQCMFPVSVKLNVHVSFKVMQDEVQELFSDQKSDVFCIEFHDLWDKTSRDPRYLHFWMLNLCSPGTEGLCVIMNQNGNLPWKIDPSTRKLEDQA